MRLVQAVLGGFAAVPPVGAEGAAVLYAVLGMLADAAPGATARSVRSQFFGPGFDDPEAQALFLESFPPHSSAHKRALLLELLRNPTFGTDALQPRAPSDTVAALLALRVEQNGTDAEGGVSVLSVEERARLTETLVLLLTHAVPLLAPPSAASMSEVQRRLDALRAAVGESVAGPVAKVARVASGGAESASMSHGAHASSSAGLLSTRQRVEAHLDVLAALVGAHAAGR
eukprot:TRINITY_DN4425_c1_g1_i6.p3 TRINITY_DN4425_c1_g1~~TRINITY_DN4425_c1_g1_i6.p3  ORF type:complete len:230 (+),score=71.41 TRINITY_DN4425_c1_g1_i6:250-939(+)